MCSTLLHLPFIDDNDLNTGVQGTEAHGHLAVLMRWPTYHGSVNHEVKNSYGIERGMNGKTAANRPEPAISISIANPLAAEP